jgi:hypothetical protein
MVPSMSWCAKRVPELDPTNPVDLNLIQHHHMFTIKNVQAQSNTYMGNQTHQAKDAIVLMFTFLCDSITSRVGVRISTDMEKFTMQAKDDGPSYLQAILLKFDVETRVTICHLKQKLQCLLRAITELEYDVAAITNQVKEIVHYLTAGVGNPQSILLFASLMPISR